MAALSSIVLNPSVIALIRRMLTVRRIPADGTSIIRFGKRKHPQGKFYSNSLKLGINSCAYWEAEVIRMKFSFTLRDVIQVALRELAVMKRCIGLGVCPNEAKLVL